MRVSRIQDLGISGLRPLAREYARATKLTLPAQDNTIRLLHEQSVLDAGHSPSYPVRNDA